MPAKASKKRKILARKIKVKPGNCPFCKDRSLPDYKDYTHLSKFVSDRARILGKDRTGVCNKHQRKLTIAIKRARHLGLLPFTPKI